MRILQEYKYFKNVQILWEYCKFRNNIIIYKYYENLGIIWEYKNITKI